MKKIIVTLLITIGLNFIMGIAYIITIADIITIVVDHLFSLKIIDALYVIYFIIIQVIVYMVRRKFSLFSYRKKLLKEMCFIIASLCSYVASTMILMALTYGIH